MEATHEERVEHGQALRTFRMDWAQRATLRHALREHPIIVMSAARLRPEDLHELAAGLGTLVQSTLEKHALPGHPLLMSIGNARDAAKDGFGGSSVGRGWHSDMSYTSEPPELTLLYGVTIPQRGGDTHFSSLYRLFERLDLPTQKRWAGLTVEHAYRSPRAGEPVRRAIHPLVRTHPESGRSLIYASPGYTARVLEVPAAESEVILAGLAAALESNRVEHRWQPQELVVWDNRALVHRATAHDERELRVCWRAAVRL